MLVCSPPGCVHVRVFRTLPLRLQCELFSCWPALLCRVRVGQCQLVEIFAHCFGRCLHARSCVHACLFRRLFIRLLVGASLIDQLPWLFGRVGSEAGRVLPRPARASRQEVRPCLQRGRRHAARRLQRFQPCPSFVGPVLNRFHGSPSVHGPCLPSRRPRECGCSQPPKDQSDSGNELPGGAGDH